MSNIYGDAIRLIRKRTPSANNSLLIKTLEQAKQTEAENKQLKTDLDDAKRLIKRLEGLHNDSVIEAAQELYEFKRRNIPMTIIRDEKDLPHCPVCNAYINRPHKMKFCAYCGQSIQYDKPVDPPVEPKSPIIAIVAGRGRGNAGLMRKKILELEAERQGIEKVSISKIREILNSKEPTFIGVYEPIGKFYAEVKNVEGSTFVACDNIDGEAYTEEFDTEELALAWLNNEFEMSELEDDEDA